jgi:acetylornithine/LysW-gamma-L-lysine aminotransferase
VSEALGFAAIQELEAAHTSGVYPKRDVALVRGEGARVWDAEGREYLDCIAGHGAANLGHCHPAVVGAIKEQAERLLLCPESFYSEPRARLLAKLAQVAPGELSRAFLCNSGTEANEAALKFSRIATGRSGVVATMRGFHGRSMGALSATWEKKYRKGVEPLVPGFTHVKYGALDALEGVVDDQTAAVILEVVQGEGGVRPGDGDYLRGAQALCRERGAMLIVDEVQTGIGRTGRLFACEHHGLEPDLLTLAKSLGGGVAIGACLIGPRVGDLPRLCHGSTFGGNPLAAAAALATLETIERDGLCARTAELGEHLRGRLEALTSPHVREVRGLGLLVGLDLRVKVTPLLRALMAEGVLALPAGPTVLRLLPPLVIEQAQLDQVVDAIAACLGAL